MNKVDIVLEYDVKSLIKYVSEACPMHHVYLVGGYLRDKYVYPQARKTRFLSWMGKDNQPKDVDIVLIPRSTSERAVPVEAVKGGLVMYIKDCNDNDMAVRGVDKLVGVRMYELSTRDVQLIVYDKFLSEEEVMLDMDMNIVQAIYNPLTDEVHVSDAFLKGHNEKVIECLHKYDEERMLVRYERMEAKLSGYTTKGKPTLQLSRKKRKAIRQSHSNSI